MIGQCQQCGLSFLSDSCNTKECQITQKINGLHSSKAITPKKLCEDYALLLTFIKKAASSASYLSTEARKILKELNKKET